MADLAASVVAFLHRNGVSTAGAIQRELAADQATLSRAIATLGGEVIRVDGGRGTRYGLHRALNGLGSSWPLFRIDPDGAAVSLGRLHALVREQYWFDAPLGEYQRLSDGLPFFLQDLVPQGFVGRTVPSRFPELGLPQRITEWNDEHVLTYLCRRGEDCIGSLILGDESLQRFLTHSGTEPPQLDAKARAREYPVLADAALSGTAAGSLAGGEHPKFTASLRSGHEVRHVLVKFSPDGNDRVAQRWSDLLVSEHVAARVLHEADLTSSVTELLSAGGRMFLEATRFDRGGLRGRCGLVSLAALTNEYLGSGNNWVNVSAGLARLGTISRDDAETVRRLATFGRLIANTDMHFGNLSFHLSFDLPPSLAPVYDMLPMLYAPTAGDVVSARVFEPPLPTGDTLDVWGEMAELAVKYWQEVASHDAISEDFAAIAKRNAERVATVAKLVPRQH